MFGGSERELDIPACPRCSIPMIVRATKRNGQRFWGCRTFPKCWGRLAYRQDDDNPELPMDQELFTEDDGPGLSADLSEEAYLDEERSPLCPVCQGPTEVTSEEGVAERRCVVFPQCPGELGGGRTLPFVSVRREDAP